MINLKIFGINAKMLNKISDITSMNNDLILFFFVLIYKTPNPLNNKSPRTKSFVQFLWYRLALQNTKIKKSTTKTVNHVSKWF